MNRLEVPFMLCSCGHIFPTPPTDRGIPLVSVDHECLKCDPEGFHLRLVYQLVEKRGYIFTPQIEEICRQVENEHDPIELDGGK